MISLYVYILSIVHLNNYFDFHVCLSIRGSVLPSFRHSVCPKTSPNSCSLSQNVTNKSYLVCVKSEKYASWVTLRAQLDCCRRGKAEVCIIKFKTIWSEFQRPSQTAPTEAKPRCVYSILKPHGQSSRGHVRLLSPRRSRGKYTQF